MSERVITPPEALPVAVAIYRRALERAEYAALESWLTTFYPFQLRWLLEARRRAAAVKARQIGWSHSASGNAVIWGAFHGENTTVISVGEKESVEVLEKAKRHATVLHALGSKMARPTKSNSEELHFASGGRILALPSSGGRGYSGNVILDEYAYQRDQVGVWDAAAAVTMLGNFRLRVISTPNGAGDGFHELIEGIESGRIPGYGLHQVTIDDAIAAGYPVNLEECWAIAKGDPRVFDQLFRCKFLDGQLQYIPSDAVKQCSVERIERFLGGGYGFYAGLDIAENHDRTVLVVVFMDSRGVRWIQHVATCKRTDWRELERIVAEAFRMFRLRRLCIDVTGLGTFEGQRFQAKYGDQRVECVRFTEGSKEDLATHLYSAFTKETVRVPKDDGAVLDKDGKAALPPGAARELRDDVCKIRRVITAAGNVRYDAPRTEAGHADSAWALALALHACTAPITMRDERTLPIL